MTEPALLDLNLEDRYRLDDGVVFMTGLQALVRAPIAAARRDRTAGLRIGTFISGYPGSPLGGYDLALGQARRWLPDVNIKFVPGLNEEVAAASVWGTQMTDIFGHSRFDGVTGIWYGKSPGVDRSMDLFRHGNIAGTTPLGALVALAGDDPVAKSSTLPSQSEGDFIDCGMPVLFPGSVAELLEFGIHAISLSRLAGLWVAVKAVTNLCDGASSVRLAADKPLIALPDLGDFRKPSTARFQLMAPRSVELERHLFEQRLPAAVEYARANGLNAITQTGPNDRIGIVAAGKTYSDLRQALLDMGLGTHELTRLGVRLLKIGMLYPFDYNTLRKFGDRLDEIVVVEEKRDLIETALCKALVGNSGVRVLGKQDETGKPLFPQFGELDADAIAEQLGPRLLRLADMPTVKARLDEIRQVRNRRYMSFLPRVPNYCSGCPHSRSTVAVDGQLNGGGIGCHTMGALIEQPERELRYITPMGAEGAVWIGAAAFVDPEHLTQNVGDGTFYHSASQSLRACVAADVNITFRILYNGHVSMTGGQAITGSRGLDTLCRQLKAEGVRRIIVVSDEPGRYTRKRVAGRIRVRDREEYEASLRELQKTPGVTALIFDQQCAAEKRRARKRGKLPEPEKHVIINEDVCEGCGDCGAVSNCMSVQPVETEFGRKTQIHQLSCNKDYSCLKGDCPSFLTVYSRGGPKHRAVEAIDANSIPEPLRAGLDGIFRIYMPGIGGTGVVTTNQILAVAAMLEGHGIHSLDQTGLAQKGGAVLSSLAVFIGDAEPERSNKVGLAHADLVLALDLLGASAPANLDRLSQDRTVVVGDSAVQPTADAIRDVKIALPPNRLLRSMVVGYSKVDRALLVPASKTAESLFHDQSAANLFVVGVAYQAGWLPIGSRAIEKAIEMNGVAVQRNIQAFRYGRLYFEDPARLDRAAMPSLATPDDSSSKYLAHIGRRDRVAYSALLQQADQLPRKLRRLLAIRVGQLILHQSPAYARRYLRVIDTVAGAENSAVRGSIALTEVAARNLYKLMAYKDEYEVARLLLSSEWEERVRDGFQRATVKYNLHVPALRALGLKHKLELGIWFRPILVVLRTGKRLRGTRLDIFGRTKVRRVERELPEWYVRLLSELAGGLSPANHAEAVAIADLADRIRGYEEIKLRNVATVQEEVASRLARWRESPH